MASYVIGSPATTRALNRAPISRVRTGCLTCRARKKKCDERKPRCHGCERNYVTCRWPPHVQASMCKSPSSSHEDERELQNPDTGRDEFPYNESRLHSADGRAATNMSLVLTPSLPEPETTRCKDGRSQVLYPANAIRYFEPRQGNVDGDGGNFNDNRPARNSSDSIEHPVPEYHTLKMPQNFTSSSPQAPKDWMATIPAEPSLFPGQPPSTFYFLSHYLHTTANHLVNGASPINPFLVFMVPLAFSSELIHQLLLTQSAAHWVRRSRDRPGIMPKTHYGKSLRLFRESINDYIVRADGNVILLGVGALTLCFIEVCIYISTKYRKYVLIVLEC
jgi:Fungal specific transcription factor domain/Fungal Zn(2)-Cys(6) binuclear cluster domain